MSDIKFGTDGWRGAIAEDYTFDNVRRCTQGFVKYLKAHGAQDKGIVIGYDQRFGSEHFAAAAAEVAAANGVKVWLTQSATPTPVISFSVTNKQAAGGINITASHNPPTDNGFKVRDENGGAVAPEGLDEIEAAIPPIAEVQRIPLEQAVADGLVEIFDPAPAYLEQIHRLVDVDRVKNAGFKILVEPMWGNGIGWLPRILEGGSTEIIEIHDRRNPIFPEMKRPEPIPPNVDVGLQATVEHGADVCIIFDGDADRVGAGTGEGRFINQLEMYALLALYMLDVRGQRGPIVKTISTTDMLKKLGQMYDVPVYETGVGFKYVAPKMVEVDALIGGEESGGFAFQNHVPERDGILAGLYLLDFMCQKNMTAAELLDYLFEKVGAHYYDRIDTRLASQEQKEAVRQHLDSSRPDTLGGLEVTGVNTLDGYKYELADGGWMLIRFSGTEPLIRIYTETTHKDKVQTILQDGLKYAGIG